MNIENLKRCVEDKILIKNYKGMCGVLEEEFKTSTHSKIAQQKEWDRFFKSHKEGRQYIVDEFYDIPIDKIENRGKSEGSRNNNSAEYIQDIEKLILNLLIQGSKGKIGFGKVFLSKNNLLKELKMINSNYPYCKQRIPKLSKFMNISVENVEDWYSSTGSMLQRNLECALKNLDNQSLVVWSKEITVAKALALAEISEDGNEMVKTTSRNEYDEEVTQYKYYADTRVKLEYREGTDSEKTFIMKTERDILKEYDVKSKQTIIRMGLWDSFREKVDKIVLKELDIAFYYKSYKILFNEEHVIEAGEDLYDKCEMDKLKQLKEENILNRSFINRSIANAEKKHSVAVELKSGIFGHSKYTKEHLRMERRADDDYLKGNHILNDNLILTDAIIIKKKVRETKLGLSEAEGEEIDKLLRGL